MEKIKNRRRLAALFKSLRRRGKRIVFTNGCFDLLHAGHARVLERAKKLGDVLVVAVNSDESVRRLKGPHRPLVLERFRAELLAALACVDFVTVFDEDTPYEIIQELKPDVLVKGGDYSKDKIVGHDLVRRVVRVPFLKNHSTTKLVNKIMKRYG